jgi:phosphohistidine phosphatase
MKIYFLRHAEAEDGPIDDQRPLTEKGRRDARRMGCYLGGLEVEFDMAFTSPLVRAVQTAELVLKHGSTRGKAKLKETESLLNEMTEAAFRTWLKGLPAVEAILLVGHEPSLSNHVRKMIGLPVTTALPLAKGALARVDTEDGQSGALRLLLSPKQLP